MLFINLRTCRFKEPQVSPPALQEDQFNSSSDPQPTKPKAAGSEFKIQIFITAIITINISSAADVICISSDSEEDKGPRPAPLKSEAIDISSDSSDDVIFTGEVKDEKTELEDVNNR